MVCVVIGMFLECSVGIEEGSDRGLLEVVMPKLSLKVEKELAR